MISRYEVWLDGIALSSLHPDIYVADIDHELTVSRDTQTRAQGGSYAGKQNVDNISVKVLFAVEAYDIADRQRIVSDVAAWAKGNHWLETNDRPDKRLRVVCEEFPTITSAKQWTSELSMTFTAYDWPYWQDIAPTTATASATANTAKTMTLYCPGQFPAPLEFDVVPSASMTSLTVSVNGYSISLSSITAASGSHVTLSYIDDRHIMQIKVGSTSVLDKRTAASSDDLLLAPGNNTVSITGDAASSVTLKVRGLTL